LTFPETLDINLPWSFFLYTGEKGRNDLIMKFQKDSLVEYKSNDFQFVQKFGEYSCNLQRLEKKDLEIIIANKDFKADFIRKIPNKGVSWV
jgi:hypothetical protein